MASGRNPGERAGSDRSGIYAARIVQHPAGQFANGSLENWATRRYAASAAERARRLCNGPLRRQSSNYPLDNFGQGSLRRSKSAWRRAPTSSLCSARSLSSSAASSLPFRVVPGAGISSPRSAAIANSSKDLPRPDFPQSESNIAGHLSCRRPSHKRSSAKHSLP